MFFILLSYFSWFIIYECCHLCPLCPNSCITEYYFIGFDRSEGRIQLCLLFDVASIYFPRSALSLISILRISLAYILLWRLACFLSCCRNILKTMTLLNVQIFRFQKMKFFRSFYIRGYWLCEPWLCSI